VEQTIVSVHVLVIVVHATIHKEKERKMRKTKFKLVVQDSGALNTVTAVLPSDLAKNPDHTYVGVSEPIAQQILREIDKGNMVQYPKTKKKSLKLIDFLIEVDPASGFGKRKNDEIANYRHMINRLFLNMNLMDMYDFMMIQNRFNSLGHFITEDNKEEVYLAIINDGDESLITDLENYLTAMEELNAINKRYKKFRGAIHKIVEAKDEEDLDSVIDSLPSL
jgi:hypothetical protein